MNEYYFLVNMALVHMLMNNMLKMMENLNVILFLMDDIKMKDQHLDQVSMIEIHRVLSVLLMVDDEKNAFVRKKRENFKGKNKREKKKRNGFEFFLFLCFSF